MLLAATARNVQFNWKSITFGLPIKTFQGHLLPNQLIKRNKGSRREIIDMITYLITAPVVI